MFVFHEADAFKKKQKAEKNKGCDSRKIRYCGSVVTLQEFLGGSRDYFSPWGFGTLELPERAPRLGKTRISAVSAMSGMAWPNRGLKDMTSMSGLRQGFPQENGLRPVI